MVFQKNKKMINKEYEEIIKAAKAGGKVAKKYFGKILEVTTKSNPSDLRTNADLESEKEVIKILSKKFPTYNIISEEAGEMNKNSEFTFFVDPIDGTNNFVMGIPYFSTSIGLMKGDETIFGAVYNPILDNIYFAEKGKGAYLNNKRIFVNKESDIKNCSISAVVSYRATQDLEEKFVVELYKKSVKRVLTNWSMILDFCLLASGKMEAMLVAIDVSLYDFVAGKLIAKEAGALVTDLKGATEKNDKNSTFLVSNGTKIHKEILNSK
jgi:myo-inositol-1(or 4)-monophosphatase